MPYSVQRKASVFQAFIPTFQFQNSVKTAVQRRLHVERVHEAVRAWRLGGDGGRRGGGGGVPAPRVSPLSSSAESISLRLGFYCRGFCVRARLELMAASEALIGFNEIDVVMMIKVKG